MQNGIDSKDSQKVDRKWFKSHPFLWYFILVCIVFFVGEFVRDIRAWLVSGSTFHVGEYILAISIATGFFIGQVLSRRKTKEKDE